MRPPPTASDQTAGGQTAVGSAQTGTAAPKNPLVDVDDLNEDPFSSGGYGIQPDTEDEVPRELSNRECGGSQA